VQDDLHKCSHYDIANWRKKADRLALCRYLLTQELLGGDVGSVVMFAIPQDANLIRQGVEHFLHTVPHVVKATFLPQMLCLIVRLFAAEAFMT
jgi:hypothetical protein